MSMGLNVKKKTIEEKPTGKINFKISLSTITKIKHLRAHEPKLTKIEIDSKYISKCYLNHNIDKISNCVNCVTSFTIGRLGQTVNLILNFRFFYRSL